MSKSAERAKLTAKVTRLEQELERVKKEIEELEADKVPNKKGAYIVKDNNNVVKLLVILKEEDMEGCTTERNALLMGANGVMEPVFNGRWLRTSHEMIGEALTVRGLTETYKELLC